MKFSSAREKPAQGRAKNKKITRRCKILCEL